MSFSSIARFTAPSTYFAIALLGLGPKVVAQTTPPNPRAAELFAQQCALCHDVDGRARNPIAKLMSPKPRDFGEGLFQLSSGDNGVPVLDDLERVIERGLPGSGMPAFPWIASADRRALAAHVQNLAIEAIATRIQDDIHAHGDSLDRTEALKMAEWEMTPDEPEPFGAFPDPTADTLALGKRLYLENCSACHGISGQGRAIVPGYKEGDAFVARDLRLGLLKGGTRLTDIARRIRAGMPGRGMPPTLLGVGETEALAVYVSTLIPKDAEYRYSQTRQSLHVKHAKGALPGRDSDAWKSANEVRLVLSPLTSRPNAVVEAHVAAMHDGESIVFRIRYRDPTRDDRALGPSRLPDGIALQFSSDAEPALFGMGSGHHPTNLWHWKSFHPEKVAAFFDLLGGRGAPQAREQLANDGSGRRAPAGLLEPEKQAGSSAATGPGSALTAGGGEARIDVTPTYLDGEWQIVMKRPLKARFDDETAFAASSHALFALAVWNGSAGDYGPRKSISIWNDLTLEP